MRISDWSSDVCSSDLTERSEATILTTTLLFAATWLASEYLRATLFTGFAWNPLGVTLLPTGMAIASTLIGTYGLGALAILASGAILLTLRRQFRPAAPLTAPLVALKSEARRVGKECVSTCRFGGVRLHTKKKTTPI